MAIAKPELTELPWTNPIWPDSPPEPSELRLVYGSDADELVVLFDNIQRSLAYFDFIGTPDKDYAAIKVDMDSGVVIGVLVYPLAAFAVERHPEWRPALTPNPSPAVANRIVLDIKQLYDRYGLVPDTPELE